MKPSMNDDNYFGSSSPRVQTHRTGSLPHPWRSRLNRRVSRCWWYRAFADMIQVEGAMQAMDLGSEQGFALRIQLDGRAQDAICPS
jgi:hypothetical protein